MMFEGDRILLIRRLWCRATAAEIRDFPFTPGSPRPSTLLSFTGRFGLPCRPSSRLVSDDYELQSASLGENFCLADQVRDSLLYLEI
jgi:hypothetical protein